MTKFFTKIASVVSVLALVATMSFADTAFAAETVSGNTSSGENQPGWLFNRDTSTDSPYEFNVDQKSIGNGSLYVLPISSSPSDKFIAENFVQTTIADTNSISFDFMIHESGDASDAEHFYMNVYANFGESSPTKFYDCRYDVIANVGSTGGFTTVTFDPSQSYDVATRTGAQASPHACPSVPSDMDGISTTTPSTIRVFAISVGDTSANDSGISGYVDNVVVDLDSGSETYDFEPEVVVTNSEGEFYMTIQEAVDGTEAGGTVIIPEGTFEENVTVNKELTISGSGPATEITPASGTAFFVSANVSIENLSIEGNGSQRGIEVANGGVSLTVADVETSSLLTGIYLNPGSSASISNFLSDGNAAGIGVDQATNVTIADSVFTDNTDEAIGFTATGAEHVTVNGSTFDGNTFAIKGYTAWPATYSGTEIFVNAQGNWWGEETGPTHPSNVGGTGDAVTDGVNFTNFCTNEDCDVEENEVEQDEDEDDDRSSSASGGRTGGGGGGSSSNDDDDDAEGQVLGVQTGPTTTSGGMVLGASAYNFTRDLTIGSTGADVTALQAMLIASGDLMIAAPTGYFGELTRAALAKWQARHGVAPAVGYFGPITRAAIAAMVTPVQTMTAEERAALIAELLEQVAAIQAQLAENMEDEA